MQGYPFGKPVPHRQLRSILEAAAHPSTGAACRAVDAEEGRVSA
jgi:hypothetical protein